MADQTPTIFDCQTHTNFHCSATLQDAHCTRVQRGLLAGLYRSLLYYSLHAHCVCDTGLLCFYAGLPAIQSDKAWKINQHHH